MRDTIIDRHDSMLAVATARQTSAGGSGVLSLWSVNRSFMSLSVIEGHKEGAIADFVWVKTPQIISKTNHGFNNKSEKLLPSETPVSKASNSKVGKNLGSPTTDNSTFDGREKFGKDDQMPVHESSSASYIWQNVVSVGRDGQCLMQSFARGERRIRKVPSSCFAIANLSPFQKGYGSLQCFSVYQEVPNRAEDDFMLTALRQDKFTNKAPGEIFKSYIWFYLILQINSF